MAHDAQAETPKLIEVADGLWVRQEIDNLTWMDLGGAGLVIDALEKVELRDEVVGEIRRTLGDTPVKYLFNTHLHYDHVALNDAFVAEFGCEVLNVQTRSIGPEGLELVGESRRAQILPAPGCHTDEDCVLWLESLRVLAVGDIFGWGCLPLLENLRQEGLDRLVETYQWLLDFQPEVVIPGHGPLCGAAELRRFIQYLQELIEAVRMLADEGRTDEQIHHACPPPDDMRHWWRFLRWKHDDTISKVLKGVRRGWL
jgi:cyclase